MCVERALRVCSASLAGVSTIDRAPALERPDRAVIRDSGLAPSPSTRTASASAASRGLTLPLRAVWDLYCAYEAELRARDVWDFADVILHAGAVASSDASAYSAIVIDKAQDLTAAMIRLLHRLVGEEPDALTLIGDGEQSIYPGATPSANSASRSPAAASS
jgi:superfamily I DNA/RNA helicase